MEGLEIRELLLNSVIAENRIFRIDSSFFGKRAYNTDIYIKQKPHFFLKDKEVVSGPFGSTLKSESYLSEGIPFVRIENIKGGFDINKSEIIYISKENNELLKNSQLFTDDLILSKVGNSIGYYARVDEEIEHCNISENNLGIKLQNYPILLRHYILTYFNCKTGFELTLRRISGNAQPKLNVFDVTEIPIPEFSNEFYQLISNSILKSKEKVNSSKQIYSQAETLLLSTLGLDNFAPNQEKVNVKSFKESFLATGRLDAEYYQKKYEEIIAHIRKQKYDLLGNLVNIEKSIEPGSDAYQDEGIPFVRVSNLTKMGLSEPEIHLDEKKYKDILKPRKDTILLSKDGSVGIAYKVTEDMNSITSGAILHLTVNSAEVLPDYLTLALNSKVVQMQAERDAGGSILQHWKPSEISQVEIPIIDKKIQEKIAALIQESFQLKKQSEELLERAKRAVEIAIEEGEEKGMEELATLNLIC